MHKRGREKTSGCTGRSPGASRFCPAEVRDNRTVCGAPNEGGFSRCPREFVFSRQSPADSFPRKMQDRLLPFALLEVPEVLLEETRINLESPPGPNNAPSLELVDFRHRSLSLPLPADKRLDAAVGRTRASVRR